MANKKMIKLKVISIGRHYFSYVFSFISELFGIETEKGANVVALSIEVGKRIEKINLMVGDTFTINNEREFTLEEIKKTPLCYDNGLYKNDDDGEFIRGQAHFKGHIIKLLTNKKNVREILDKTKEGEFNKRKKRKD